MKDAKDQHHLSKSASSHFAQFLPIIKHRLVQLLGENDLREEVVKKIETLRQKGTQVTFKHLWRLYGGPKLKRERDTNKQRVSVLEARVAQKDAELNTLRAQSALVVSPQVPQEDRFARLQSQRDALQDHCRKLEDECHQQQRRIGELQTASTDHYKKLREAEKMREHFESALSELFGLGAKGADRENVAVPDDFKEELREYNSGPARMLECVGPIGNGAHGSVSCERLHVAIKRIDLKTDPDMTKYYVQEARVSLMLHHENMVPTLNRFFEGGELCLVMPYYRAGSLHGIIENIVLPLEEAAHVAYQLLQYLRYLHEDAGYMHRDIKGDNVLVADDGQLKVADLGLCGPIENRRTGIGTPQYLAPEAVQNRLEEQEQLLTTAVDIYSFGMLMYKLLMKRYPHRLADKTPKNLSVDFQNNNVAAWNEWAENLMKETCKPGFCDRVKEELQCKKNLTDECRTFILDCLHADPKQRPSAGQLLGYSFIEKRQSAPWERRVAQWLHDKPADF